MRFLTKILDFLATICVVLLFLKFAIHTANGIFNWHLQWYFLEDIPYMAIILFVLIFVFAIPSEMIKDKSDK
ncbi:epilancin biosynthesis-related protein ElxI1 [Staphylococcus casei]|uniref:Immunity protein n=1 Tax=Staphylococcus casei TaxID=201828 RepID=A0ABZ2WG98_9STAP